MWMVPAVILFLLGQLYLFRCLRKLDRFSIAQSEEREVLRVALADPVIEEQLSNLLRRYSADHPDVDLVIHVDSGVMDAVRQRKADVGLCPEAEVRGGLNSLTLCFPGETRRQMVWKDSGKAGEFVGCLWQTYGK